jgi:hypothetical protein
MVRAIAVLCVVMAVGLATQVWGATATEPARGDALASAQQAYEQNVALGRSLNGGGATEAQAAEAERLFEAALSGAQAEVRANPRSAEAHLLAGMVQCMGYRAVSVAAGEGEAGAMVRALRAGGSQCEEGLAEIRAAMRLAPTRPEYGLDYVRALQACGKVDDGRKEAEGLWDRRAGMSGEQCARCALELADLAGQSGDQAGEATWLRRRLDYAPHDMAMATRLIGVMATQPGVAWLPYTTGKELAAREKKPMVIVVVSDQCGWCRKLEQETLTNARVVACCKDCVCSQVTVEDEPGFARALGVRSFPQTIVVSASGNETGRIMGYVAADRYVIELQRALQIE